MTTTLDPGTHPAHRTLARPGLMVSLRREYDQPVLAREPVTGDDLADAASEMWRDSFLRRGRLDLAVGDLSLRVVGISSSKGAPHLAGYALQATSQGDGSDRRSEFSASSVDSAAQRCQSRLLQTGVLQSGETVLYELEEGTPEAGGPPPAAALPEPFELTVNDPPLHILSVPLDPLLEKARPEGECKADVFPVFYTARAFSWAEKCSRKGAEINPFHESGAVLVGFLCTCPHTGELFVIVTEAFEVTDAKASLVTLEYSGKSWARLQSMIKARQAIDPAVRILGQAHGHNFLPNDGKTCAECAMVEVCSTSNLFASSDDRNWTRAVFSHQPWALCQIFGLTARGDLVQGLFTLHDGRLQKRDFYVLPDFDPGRHPTLAICR